MQGSLVACPLPLFKPEEAGESVCAFSKISINATLFVKPKSQSTSSSWKIRNTVLNTL